MKVAIDEADPFLPIDSDKQGLTEDRFKMIESMVLQGHTDNEICDKLKIKRSNLIRWVKEGEQDAKEGAVTLKSQLRDAIFEPRLKIVERLRAVLASKALGRYKTRTKTIQKRLDDGSMETTTETQPLPSSKDLMFLLENLDPENFGASSKAIKLKLESVVPVTPVLTRDEWVLKYANRGAKSGDIRDAEIEEVDSDDESNK